MNLDISTPVVDGQKHWKQEKNGHTKRGDVNVHWSHYILLAQIPIAVSVNRMNGWIKLIKGQNAILKDWIEFYL